MAYWLSKKSTNIGKISVIQESIPVGCILPACANCTCFNSHQMSAPGVVSWSELSSKGLQWWPADVTSSGKGGSRSSKVSCLQGEWARVRGLYSNVQCTMGNGHMGPPTNRQTWLKTLPSITSGHINTHYICWSNMISRSMLWVLTLLTLFPMFVDSFKNLFAKGNRSVNPLEYQVLIFTSLLGQRLNFLRVENSLGCIK